MKRLLRGHTERVRGMWMYNVKVVAWICWSNYMRSRHVCSILQLRVCWCSGSMVYYLSVCSIKDKYWFCVSALVLYSRINTSCNVLQIEIGQRGFECEHTVKHVPLKCPDAWWPGCFLLTVSVVGVWRLILKGDCRHDTCGRSKRWIMNFNTMGDI